MTETKIGFVGVGNMGQPIATNLLQAGYNLHVYDRRLERLLPLAALGATPHTSLRDIGEAGGLVLSMVPDDDALNDITLSDGGLLEQLCPGGVHLSLSTISPVISRQMADLYAERGGIFLAATVLGRPEVAKAAALSISLAGPIAAKQRVLPILKVLGPHIEDLGENVIASNVFKLAANFLILAALESMGEAGALLDAYGVKREDFFQSMIESPLFGGAVYNVYGRMIGTQNYADNNFQVGMGIKDAQLVFDTAERMGLAMPVLNLALHHLHDAKQEGRADESWAILAEFTHFPQSHIQTPVAGD